MPSEQDAKKRIIVIGSGLGGLSAAIALRQHGYQVDLYEKNPRIGGKLNVLQSHGYTFDLGPSILTLPHLFERLFERSGKRLQDYIPLRVLRPHWRNFFEDGSVIDLDPDPEKMAHAARKAGEDPAAVRAFLDYSGRLYDITDRGYFEQGLDTVKDFQNYYGLWEFRRFDLLRSMHGSVSRFFKTRYMRDIFDFFIKYVGSSAYRAPAFMNCLPTIQFRHDLWYVDGGMYKIARGLQRLMDELGIRVNLNCEVREILRDGATRVKGIGLTDGTLAEADIVVSNMEVIPAYRDLLKEDAAFMKTLERFEPACSGLVLDLGLDCKYEQLAHHNFFFSGNQREHFRSVFQKYQIPEDPTVYLVAASRTDPTVAPEGCDCLKILPHIPYLHPDRPVPQDAYRQLRDRVIEKLERNGLTGLRKHIVFEHMWTPEDIQRQYYSNGGSIYGVVSDRFKNLAFKAPKQSTRYENLFFAGGSVNPGGGMPMVILSGQNTARRIVAWDRGS